MALHLLFVALGVAVPLYGIFAWGWGIGTVVILLAIECLVSFGPMGLRIVRHERASQDPRHRQRSSYARFGRWVIPATRGRFATDYVLRGGVGALALVAVSCMMPLIYRKEFPELAPLLHVQWDGVALGAAAAAVLALLEVASRWRSWGSESFRDLHRAAAVPLLLMIGLVLVTLFVPLLVDWIRHPLALVLPLLALKAWIEASRGAPLD